MTIQAVTSELAGVVEKLERHDSNAYDVSSWESYGDGAKGEGASQRERR